MSEQMEYSVSPAGRLLNLVIALVNTNVSMTKQQVRAGVAGYGDAPSDDAFERMFERDKDTLRDLGIPIVTVDSGGHSGDVGYRIDVDAYALPPVDLSSAEWGVLGLAAQLWQDKTLRTDMSRALVKLRAAGAGETANDVVAGLAPSVRAAGDAFGPLLDAIDVRREVSFTYRAANTGLLGERRIRPWRLVARGGGWYVVGFDVDRAASRAFRLSRIESRVRPVGPPEAFEVPAQVDVDSVRGEAGAGGVALIEVVPERAQALRARGRTVGSQRGRDVVQVEYSFLGSMAGELVGYADAIVVLEPPELRREVISRLRAATRLTETEGGTGRG